MEKTETPEYLYKIISVSDWQKSQTQNDVVLSSMDTDFIHLATKEQVPHVAEKFWKNSDYVVLTLDTKKLPGRLIYETNPGGTTKYYHLYDGSIPKAAVVDTQLSE